MKILRSLGGNLTIVFRVEDAKALCEDDLAITEWPREYFHARRMRCLGGWVVGESSFNCDLPWNEPRKEFESIIISAVGNISTVAVVTDR